GVIEGYHKRSHAPVERETFSDGFRLTKRIDLRITRAHPTRPARHVAPPGEDEEGVSPEFVGHDHGALDQLLARAGELGMLAVIRAAAAFNAPSDAIEYFDTFQRIFADGCLAAEHDGVGLFEDRVRYVGDLGARRNGRVDHAFEHVRRDDHGPGQ